MLHFFLYQFFIMAAEHTTEHDPSTGDGRAGIEQTRLVEKTTTKTVFNHQKKVTAEFLKAIGSPYGQSEDNQANIVESDQQEVAA
ncbi:MAG: hypothetical protein JWM56_1391 [Candidatus Peribacteria bacterium]|nr:hypothetical protein [Candidatus Peribacteria bacterium]